MVFKSVLREEMTEYMSSRYQSRGKDCCAHDKQVLESFDKYLLKTECSSKNVDEKRIVGWIHTLEGKSSTIANKVIILRLFLIYLRGYGIEAFIPVIPKVHDDYTPYILDDAEMARIFETADNLDRGPVQINILIHQEMPMILRMLYGCGLRIGETLALQMKDIDFDTGCLIMRHAKGKKQRIVPMHSTLTGILQNYCHAMGITGDPEKYLFPIGTEKGPLSVKNAKHKFDWILEKNDIRLEGRKPHERGPCLHTIRHVFAFKSFKQVERSGMKINDAVPYLSIYLGHDSLLETEKYLKFSSEAFPEAMELFDDFATDIWPEVTYEE